MADELKYPLTRFSFRVEIGGQQIASFTEVTGLSMETQVAEYRGGDSKWPYVKQKIPGLNNVTNVTLNRGTFIGEVQFFEHWLNTHKLQTLDRKEVKILLTDENGDPLFSWTLRLAWVSKLIWPDMNSTSNDVAIQKLELVHEGITHKAEKS